MSYIVRKVNKQVPDRRYLQYRHSWQGTCIQNIERSSITQ